MGRWTFPRCRQRPRLARAARTSNPESNLQPRGFLDAGDFAKCGKVRRTGPSFTGRPRSVLWCCYLRAVLVLGAGFSFPLAALFFFSAFSFSALTTAMRSAFALTYKGTLRRPARLR